MPHAMGAELAAARVMGLEWSGTWDRTVVPDLTGKKGEQIEIRHVMHENYNLSLRKRDRVDYRLVLVDGLLPRFRLVGWEFAGNISRSPRAWPHMTSILYPREILRKEVWW